MLLLYGFFLSHSRFARSFFGSRQPTSKALLQALSPDLNPMWTAASTSAIVHPFNLPPSTTLILADVDAGSNTPSMVGGVMSWKARDATTGESIRIAIERTVLMFRVSQRTRFGQN